MADIQSQINQHLNADPETETPILNMVIDQGTGSFSCPRDARILVRGGSSATCSGNSGGSELQFASVQTVVVSGYQGGILRIENAQNADITCSADTILHLGNIQSLKLNLTSTRATITNSTIDQATFTSSTITSLGNTYQGQCSFTGGVVRSNDDVFQGQAQIEQEAWGRFVNPTFQGSCTISSATATCMNGTYQGTVTLQEARFTDVGGQMQGTLTSQGDGAISLRDTQITGATTITGGIWNVQNGQFQGAFSATSCIALGLNNSQLQGQCTLNLTPIVAANTTFTGEVTGDAVLGRFDQCTFMGLAELISNSSIDSTNNTYSGEMSVSGNLQSKHDQFTGMLTGVAMTGPCLIHNADGATMTLVGDTSLDLTISKSTFANTNLTILAQLRSNGTQYANLNILLAGTVLLNSGTCAALTATRIGTLLAPNMVISSGTITSCGLSVTQNTTGLVITGCTAIDALSAGLEVIDTLLLCRDSVVQANDSVVAAVGGSVAAVAQSVVLGQLALITNIDGLSLGSGINPINSFFCITSTPGGNFISSAVSLTTTVYTGALSNLAIVGGIDNTAGAGMINIAGTSISNGAGAGITNTAGTLIASSAPSITEN